MTSSPTLPPQQQLRTTQSADSRESSIAALTPRRRSASAAMVDVQRSHSVPPHLMAASADSRSFPASSTASAEASSSRTSTSSASTSSAGMTDDELASTASSLSSDAEPRLIKSTSTPEALSNHAITRSSSASSTSSAPSQASPPAQSASSPAHYTSSSPSSTSTSSSSAASLLSSTLASLSSTVTSFFRPSSPSPSTPSIPATRLIPYYSVDTVAQHSTADSFWTIVHGRVYDLTTYLSLHPGGYRLLFKNGGADSTSDFVGLRHSKRAVAVLDAYWIGDLVGTRPMREVPAGLGSAVKGSPDGCVAVGNFAGTGGASGMSAATRLKKATTGGGSSGLLGDALRLGEGAEGVRRNHSASPSSGGRVVPLTTKYQSTRSNMPPPHPRAVHTSASSTGSPPAPLNPPPAFSINLITPPEPISPPSTAPLTSTSALPASSSSSLDVVPVTFLVSSVQHLAADTVQLVFRLPASSTASFCLPLSGHITIEVPSMSSSAPLRRQYTPVASTLTSFTLLVRTYTDQQVGSHYLASLRIGQPVKVHGPYTSLTHPLTAFTDVVLICGGSGITPMYQLIQHIHHLSTTPPTPNTATATTTPRLHLIYSARTTTDIWLRQPIDSTFALHPGSWHHTYLLSRATQLLETGAGGGGGGGGVECVGRLDGSVLSGWLAGCGVLLGAGVLCCVCGNDEYCSSVSDWLRQQWRVQQSAGGGSGSMDSELNIHIF